MFCNVEHPIVSLGTRVNLGVSECDSHVLRVSYTLAWSVPTCIPYCVRRMLRNVPMDAPTFEENGERIEKKKKTKRKLKGRCLFEWAGNVKPLGLGMLECYYFCKCTRALSYKYT